MAAYPLLLSEGVDSDLDRVMQQLYTYVWISDFHGPLINYATLVSKYNIHEVVNVCDIEPTRLQKTRYKNFGVAYRWFKTHELPNVNIIKIGIRVAQIIRRRSLRGQAVLVHCWAGMNRSACCILISRMLDDDTPETLVAALKHIRTIRPIVHPAVFFHRQLLALQDRIDLYYQTHGVRLSIASSRLPPSAAPHPPPAVSTRD